MMFMSEKQWAQSGIRVSPDTGHKDSGSQSDGVAGGASLNQATRDQVLITKTVQIERKTFHMTLRQNARGRFLRITEDVNGRRDSVILPSTGLVDFRNAINSIVDHSENLSRSETETPESGGQ